MGPPESFWEGGLLRGALDDRGGGQRGVRVVAEAIEVEGPGIADVQSWDPGPIRCRTPCSAVSK